MKKKPVQPLKTKKSTLKKETGRSNPFLFNYLWYALGIAVVLFIIASRLNLLDMPFDRDEGYYAYFGKQVLAGKTPYADFFDNKPPAFFYTYAFLCLIFGTTVKGLHLALLVITMINAWLVFRITRYWSDIRGGIIAVIVYSITGIGPFIYGFTLQAEWLVSLFILLSLALVQRSFGALNPGKILFLSGVLSGWAVFVKQPGLLLAAFVFIYLLTEYRLRGPWKETIRKAAWFAGGFMSISFLLFAIMAAYGVWDEFWFWLIEFPKHYVGTISSDQGWENFTLQFKSILTGYWIFWIAGIVALPFVSVPRHLKWLLLAFLILSLLSVVPGLRFYGHYFLLVIPAIAITAGTGFGQLAWKPAVKGNVVWQWILFAVFLIAFVDHIRTKMPYYFTKDVAKTSKTIYKRNPFAEAKTVGEYLASQSAPGEKIYVFGTEPEIYVYAGREPASRHISTFFIVSGHPKGPAWHRELMSDLERTKPAYVVFVNNQFSWAYSAKADISYWEAYANFIAANYDPVGYAERLTGTETKYIWDQAALTYTPTSENYITVYKKRE